MHCKYYIVEFVVIDKQVIVVFGDLQYFYSHFANIILYYPLTLCIDVGYYYHEVNPTHFIKQIGHYVHLPVAIFHTECPTVPFKPTNTV